MIREYAARYGVSEAILERMDITHLARMTEMARAVIFSTLKWDRAHPGWRLKGSIAERVPGLYRKRLAEEREYLCMERKLRRRQAQALRRRARPQSKPAVRHFVADMAAERMLQLAKLARIA